MSQHDSVTGNQPRLSTPALETCRGVAVSVWTCRSNELVGIGDAVALSVLNRADAVGRIVAKTNDDRIQCLLVGRHGSCSPGWFVTVDEDQLLLRLYIWGGP